MVTLYPALPGYTVIGDPISIRENGDVVLLKAQHEASGRTVCLKTFKSLDFDDINLYVKEAQLLMSASSRNTAVCQIYDTNMKQQGDQYFFTIVMEYFSRGNLDGEIKRRAYLKQPWTQGELWYHASYFIEAYAVMQSSFLAHRDIKPQNIFQTEEGLFKIGDFGVSFRGTQTVDRARTLTGTPEYLSPKLMEVFTNEMLSGELVNEIQHDAYKSDVFSLGLVFLRMCSLEEIRGFNQRQGREKMHQRLRDLENTYSKDFLFMLVTMLEQDEDRRYDFLQVKEFLQSIHIEKIIQDVKITNPQDLVDSESSDQEFKTKKVGARQRRKSTDKVQTQKSQQEVTEQLNEKLKLEAGHVSAQARMTSNPGTNQMQQNVPVPNQPKAYYQQDQPYQYNQQMPSVPVVQHRTQSQQQQAPAPAYYQAMPGGPPQVQCQMNYQPVQQQMTGQYEVMSAQQGVNQPQQQQQYSQGYSSGKRCQSNHAMENVKDINNHYRTTHNNDLVAVECDGCKRMIEDGENAWHCCLCRFGYNICLRCQ